MVQGLAAHRLHGVKGQYTAGHWGLAAGTAMGYKVDAGTNLVAAAEGPKRRRCQRCLRAEIGEKRWLTLLGRGLGKSTVRTEGESGMTDGQRLRPI